MEHLPDELLLTLFQYLHRFDLLYSFGNLNQRFQHILEPYLYEVDLTRESLSYQHFVLFYKYVVPYQGHYVRDLQISGDHQFYLFQPLIHLFTNLESLTLKSIVFFGSQQYAVQGELVTQALRISSLSTLTLSRLDVPETIASLASPNLTSLILLDESDFDYPYIRERISTIKYFSLNLRKFQSTTFSSIFKLLPNLEELRLSISNCYNPSNLQRRYVRIPKTLTKLFLEFKHEKPISEEVLKEEFLDVFKNQIQSLTLIVNNAALQISHLLSDFTSLTTFHCDVALTSPATLDLNFDNVISHESSYPLNNHMTIKVLNLTLHNQTILASDEHKFLTELLNSLPNLVTLSVSTNDTKAIIQQFNSLFSKRSSRKIRHFHIEDLRRYNLKDHHPRYPPIYHRTFFYELAQLFPNLNTVTFPCHTNFLDEYRTSLNVFLKQLQNLATHTTIT
ncbi:unnamed protein product [Adineta ricciae]|uniref:F-box domain-containing protein n=1 Tax=Adineta ricciae TaxID=249248 RepID=A0A814S2S6_ADIRI|nr:unnamed protein product [Adineta ricciae]CAF1526931.1 unnamed protein product [Adineta ricciae]